MVSCLVLVLGIPCSREYHSLTAHRLGANIDQYRALIAIQAGVERRDMAFVTAFRKYVSF